MATAAVEDWRRLVIPNRLILGLLLLWPLHLASIRAGVLSGVEAVGGALAVFLAGVLVYARRLVGGGDVKLLAAAALWAGGARLPRLLLLTGLCGGALSLLLLTPLGARFGAGRTPGRTVPAAPGANSVSVPYGAAIAGAALFVTLASVWD